MITVVGGVVLFLLFAAGLLAYQSSRMISEREASESAAPTGSLMYSVVNQAFAEHEERPEAVPLFQFTVLSGPGEQLAKGRKGYDFRFMPCTGRHGRDGSDRRGELDEKQHPQSFH